MTDKKSSKSKAEEVVSNSYEQYLESMQKRSEEIVTILKNTQARNTRIMDELIESAVAGQQELLELSKTIAASPMDYQGNMQSAIDAITSSQERALTFGKMLYTEQNEVNEKIRTAYKDMAEPFKNYADFWIKPYQNFAAMWTPNAK